MAFGEIVPTQTQLRDLLSTVLQYDATLGTFLELPEEIFDYSGYEVLATPPTFDKTLAPAVTLKTPDKRVVWLSAFRNPDSGNVVRSHIITLDPPVNRRFREPLPREDYDLLPQAGKLVIERLGAPIMTSAEVDILQDLIDSSEQFFMSDLV